jgi:hypothetical protein
MKHYLIKKIVQGFLPFFILVSCNKGRLLSDMINYPPVANPGNGKTFVDTTVIIFNDQVLSNQCYDDRPGVCWINSDSPSYGFFIKNSANGLPDPATEILSVRIKMDTSSIWEQVPANCWNVYTDPYPQSNFTYCRSTEGLSVSSWFFSMENLTGRKVDVKIIF